MPIKKDEAVDKPIAVEEVEDIVSDKVSDPIIEDDNIFEAVDDDLLDGDDMDPFEDKWEQ